MKTSLRPWQLLFLALAGWVNHRQQDAIAYFNAHWDVLASMDLTTIDVWSRSGLVTYYLLFFMELATRRVHFAGLTANPDEAWMLQVARNVTDAEEAFLRGKKYLLMDRDGRLSETFRAKSSGSRQPAD